tara:strand:+ start:297 stop:863 length:567 start_codon:yes stop_codon:yes gene_type:complete
VEEVVVHQLVHQVIQEEQQEQIQFFQDQPLSHQQVEVEVDQIQDQEILVDQEDQVVLVQMVPQEDQVTLRQLVQHKVKMVEQVLEQLLQVGVLEVEEDLHKQDKLHKVQMEVMVVMVEDFLLLLVPMVYLVEVIDIMQVVAEVVLDIMVPHFQQVLVEKAVVLLVKQEVKVQLQEMQEQQILVVAEVE